MKNAVQHANRDNGMLALLLSRYRCRLPHVGTEVMFHPFKRRKAEKITESVLEALERDFLAHYDTWGCTGDPVTDNH